MNSEQISIRFMISTATLAFTLSNLGSDSGPGIRLISLENVLAVGQIPYDLNEKFICLRFVLVKPNIASMDNFASCYANLNIKPKLAAVYGIRISG